MVYTTVKEAYQWGSNNENSNSFLMATHPASSTGLQCFMISYTQASTEHHGDARYQVRQSVFRYSLQAKPVLHTIFCHSHCSNQTVLHTTFCHSQTTFCQSLLKPNKFSTLHSASCCSNQTSYPCYILPQSLLKPNKLYVLHSASHYSNQTSSPHYIQPHSLLKQVLHTTFCQSLLKPNKFSTLCALTSLRSW